MCRRRNSHSAWRWNHHDVGNIIMSSTSRFRLFGLCERCQNSGYCCHSGTVGIVVMHSTQPWRVRNASCHRSYSSTPHLYYGKQQHSPKKKTSHQLPAAPCVPCSCAVTCLPSCDDRHDHHGADGATGSSRKKQTTEHPALSTKKSKSDEKI